MEITTPLQHCPCCARTDWQPRWTGFVVCGHCGLMTVNQSFSSDELKRFYQEEYFQGREYINYLADKPAQQRTLAGNLQVVRRYVPPGGRVLEVGCAYGFFLELIRDLYPGSIGVDVAVAGVAHARARGLDAREGDLLALALTDRFDAVCLWDTIEHLPHPYEIIREGSRLLKPGGHLFLTTGDFGALLPRLQGLRWRQIHPPTHLFYFTRRSLTELCARAGLGVLRFGTVAVHRRLGSVLEALATFHGKTLSGRLAARARRILPTRCQNACMPLNLGDTLRMVARRG